LERLCPGYRRAVAAAHRGQPLSLDAPLPLGEMLVSDWSGDPALAAVRRLESRHLAERIDRLPVRQREVVLLHYFRGNSLRTVGKRLAISPQRASQLHLSAIANLKRATFAAPP
jgi:RNA polymerase sigma factor (sigma-70 family)